MDKTYPTILHKNFVGICGVIGNGKSYVSKLIANTYGWHHINTDKLFKEVLHKPCYMAALEEFAKPKKLVPYKNGVYDAPYMFTTLFNEEQCLTDYPILKELNELNSDFLYGELLKKLMTISPDDIIILEMATLPFSKFAGLCKRIFRVERYATISDILERDPNRDYMATSCVRSYQMECFGNKKMDTIFNNGYTDEEIIRQFRNNYEPHTIQNNLC